MSIGLTHLALAGCLAMFGGIVFAELAWWLDRRVVEPEGDDV